MRVGVRFVCIYAVLYLGPFPLSVFVPALEFRLWRPLTERVGSVAGAMLGIATETPAYVGDAMVHYLYLGVAAAVALVAAVAWAALDRDRTRDARLDAALRSYLRVALAFVLINYGCIKIIPSQFPPLGLDTLYQPIGDASKMGLMWAFMGASYGYGLAAGLLEVSAGVLLMFRRTAIAGALLAAAVLAHVVVLNLAYDVPQKEYSVHLWAMAAYLLAPAVPRLLAVLAGRAVAGAPEATPWPAAGWPGKVAAWAGVVFLAYLLPAALINASRNQLASGATAPRSPLYGVWDVREWTPAATSSPADSPRWRRLVFDGPEWAGVQFSDDSYVRVRAAFDDTRSSVRLLLEGVDREPTTIAILSISRADAETRVLEGSVEGDAARIVIHRVEPRSFELVRKGFRWVAESELIR